MRRLSVATHICLALAMIAASLLLLAHALGLAPDPRSARLEARVAVAGLVGRCVADVAADGVPDRLAAVVHELVARNPDVLSVGVRLADGQLLIATDAHERLWVSGDGASPGGSQARVPILRDARPWGDVEIRFAGLGSGGLAGLLSHPLAPLLIFCIGAGFVANRLLMRRVLCYLGPK